MNYDYCEDSDHAAQFYSELKNWSKNLGYKNYSMKVSATHPASELIFSFDGSIDLESNIYKGDATGVYKRGYLPEMEMQFMSFFDFEKKEIKIFVSYSDHDFLSRNSKFITFVDMSFLVKAQNPICFDSIHKLFIVNFCTSLQLFYFSVSEQLQIKLSTYMPKQSQTFQFTKSTETLLIAQSMTQMEF